MLENVGYDVLQSISQYCPLVYCRLRLMNKSIKKVIDEVLPLGSFSEGHQRPYWTLKRARYEIPCSWRYFFLVLNQKTCGYKLMDTKSFYKWIGPMTALYKSFSVRDKCSWIKCRKFEKTVEKFCLAYLPKDEEVKGELIHLLCSFSQVDYLEKLYVERLVYSDSVLKHFALLKNGTLFARELERVQTFDNFNSKDLMNILSIASKHFRWDNTKYLLDKFPEIYVEDYKHYFQVRISLFRDLDSVAVDPYFRRDKNFILHLLENNEDETVYRFADDKLKNDKDFVLQAIKKNGRIFKFVDKKFQRDNEVALAAIESRGITVKSVHLLSDFLDKDVWFAALEHYPKALLHADKSLRNDRSFALQAVKINGHALKYLGPLYQKDREIVLAAVNKHPISIKYSDESMKKDEEIVLSAVKNQTPLLKYADESLFKDKSFVMKAVNLNHKLAKYSAFLHYHPEISKLNRLKHRSRRN